MHRDDALQGMTRHDVSASCPLAILHVLLQDGFEHNCKQQTTLWRADTGLYTCTEGLRLPEVPDNSQATVRHWRFVILWQQVTDPLHLYFKVQVTRPSHWLWPVPYYIRYSTTTITSEAKQFLFGAWSPGSITGGISLLIWDSFPHIVTHRVRQIIKFNYQSTASPFRQDIRQDILQLSDITAVSVILPVSSTLSSCIQVSQCLQNFSKPRAVTNG